MSDCNEPKLGVTPFCLHRAGWGFGPFSGAVSAGLATVSFPGARGATRRFAGPWVARSNRAVEPNVNTPLVAVSGIVGAVGGAKEKAG